MRCATVRRGRCRLVNRIRLMCSEQSEVERVMHTGRTATHAGTEGRVTCSRTGILGGEAAAAARRAAASPPSRKLSNSRSGAAAARIVVFHFTESVIA